MPQKCLCSQGNFSELLPSIGILISRLLMKNYYTRLLALIALTLFFSIKIAAQMVISSQVTPSSCFACNGSIVLSVTGGIPPYTFNWSTWATTQAINNLCPGSYDVWVSDASGVTQSGLHITVYEFSSTLPLVTCVTNVSCFGGFNGAIYLTITGGTPGYTNLWNTGATTQDMSGL